VDLDMKKLTLKTTALSVAVGLVSAAAQADLDDVRINAFGTLGVASMHGEDDSTRFGLNSEYKADETIESVSRGAVQLGYNFSDNLSGTLQLIADRGREANGIEVNVDWAFLAYQVTDELAVRGGQLRLPIFMLSETIDVGYSYPWVRPPQTYYQMVPFSSYYGADALWTINLGDGDLLIQPFAGKAEEQEINFAGFENTDVDAEDGYGLNLVYNFEYGAVRAGFYSTTGTLVDTDSVNRLDESDVVFMSVGYNLEIGDWITIFEASKKDSVAGDVTGQFLSQVPEENAWYLMVGHRFGDFTPHITYAEHSTNTTQMAAGVQAIAGEQESLMLGLRWDVSPGVAVKFEYEDVETTGTFNGRFTGSAIAPPFNPDFGNRDAEIFTIAIDYVM
jgi:opacity protein-like surface antigen